MKCKICPVCNEKSSANEMICKSCLTPMDSVEITDCDQQAKDAILKLSYENNTLNIKDGDIVGRDALGESFLSDKLTVSRKHAKFVHKNHKWHIVDMGSTNKSYLNGEIIESNKEVLIQNQDEVGLSRKVVFKVKL